MILIVTWWSRAGGDAVDEAGELGAEREVVHADRADLRDVVVPLGPDQLRDRPVAGEPGGGQARRLGVAERRVALRDGEQHRDLGLEQAAQRRDLRRRQIAVV